MVEYSAQSGLFDVAIVGYGPTGATLANLLALRGLKILVLERESALYHLPRAVHFDDETMRIFGLVGIADPLSHQILVNPGMRFVGADGTLLLDWPRPQEIGPNGWHASYRFHQPDLEKLLRGALRSQSNATIITHAKVCQLDDQGSHVDIQYENLDDSQIHTVCAKFVVGCDGAQSFVRQNIGTQMEDLGFKERWLVIDVLLKRPMPELGDHSIQHCDPVRPVTYCRSPENRRRWEIKLSSDENSAEITKPETVWNLLSKWMTPEDAVLERSAVYTFHSAIAFEWRVGRLLLAGDAAHLTPPFMGQGMCAGIRDAANLAWKLALCIQANVGDKILDTYQSERSPHVREYISTAIRLGGLINTLDRKGALDLARPNNDGRSKMNSISPRLGQGLGQGLKAGPAKHCGQLFANPMLATAERFDDVYGGNWVFLLRGAVSEITPGNSPKDLVVISAVSDPALEECLDNLETNAVLIRPDKYILGTAKSAQEIQDLAGYDFLATGPSF